MKKDIWLLIGHGSRDPESNKEFLTLVDDLRRKKGGQPIDAAFVELAEPDMKTVLESYGDPVPKRVWVLPLLFFAAGHSKTEIPEVIREVRLKFPHVEFHYGSPLGIHPILLDIVHKRVLQAEKKVSVQPKEETAILLVGRGSSDPDANGDLFKVSRLYWEQRRYGWVETCFIGVTRPDLPGGIKRCVQLGAKRIIAIPYFIFTGVLIKRIQGIVHAHRDIFSGVEILMGDYLGRDPSLLTLIEERFEAVQKGPVLMNCDVCKYQFPDLVPESQKGRS
ncbi:MAG: sirohydrochlorin chelatase [Nitrospiria bacterium]